MDNFIAWLAYKLPKRLVYWSYIRVQTHATFIFKDKSPDQINCWDAMEAWK